MTQEFEPVMEFPYLFYSPVEITIEETSQGVAMLKGTLLVEGFSRNKNLYTIEEMEQIAKRAQGVPMYYGVKDDINPNTGTMSKNLHADDSDNMIGKIIKTAFDAIKRKITFIAEVANTPKYPDIISKVKSGWGVSIGGFVTQANWIVDKIRGLCMKIKNMTVEHVQLVPPSIVRGQDEAKVEDVTIQECMVMEMPTPIQIITHLRIKGNINSLNVKRR
jgi:hypothetical protein